MNQTFANRRDANGALQGAQFDVLVVGGGIVGSGVARDAAMRGLRVALVEQHDFASGTSSRSSRLLHGGIRYLAQGRIGLVREASVEKTIVHKIAPHLAQPLPFVFPTYRGSQWSRWKMAIGVRLYDWLCGRRNLGKSSVLSRKETIERFPLVTTERLTGAVRYYDGLTNDSRLVIDTLCSAEQAGASLHNYTQFIGAERLGDVWQVELVDQQAGNSRQITARTVVNAAGPWSDKLQHSRTNLRLTKGVHLVIDRDKLPVDDAVVVAEGSRILFVIPWGERLILGTTDTDYDGDIANPRCEQRDIDYVLAATNAAFEGAKLVRGDVLSTWAGLRPLVADPNGDPSDISRRHKIEMSNPGWWDVTGGKLTTYRLMAEETITSVMKWLDLPRVACPTAEVPLVNKTEAAIGTLPPEVSRSVVERCVEREWARHLDDVMIRRTSWAYYHRPQAAVAEQVCGWMADLLGWSADQQLEEQSHYEELIGPVRSSPEMPHFARPAGANGRPVVRKQKLEELEKSG